jgi:N-acetylneuraminic acid mutarotase
MIQSTKQWSIAGNLPENKYVADAVVLNDKVYVIAGQPHQASSPTKSSPPT